MFKFQACRYSNSPPTWCLAPIPSDQSLLAWPYKWRYWWPRVSGWFRDAWARVKFMEKVDGKLWKLMQELNCYISWPYIVSSYPIWFQFYSSNNLILLFRELWDAMIFVKLLWANDIQSINSIWVCRTRMRVLFTSTNDFHPSLMVARASWLRRDLHMASCIRRCFNRLNPHEFP